MTDFNIQSLSLKETENLFYRGFDTIYTSEQKEQIIQHFCDLYLKQYGVIAPTIKLEEILKNKNTDNQEEASETLGYYSRDTNKIVLNTGRLSNGLDFLNTIFHECEHAKQEFYISLNFGQFNFKYFKEHSDELEKKLREFYEQITKTKGNKKEIDFADYVKELLSDKRKLYSAWKFQEIKTSLEDNYKMDSEDATLAYMSLESELDARKIGYEQLMRVKSFICKNIDNENDTEKLKLYKNNIKYINNILEEEVKNFHKLLLPIATMWNIKRFVGIFFNKQDNIPLLPVSKTKLEAMKTNLQIIFQLFSTRNISEKIDKRIEEITKKQQEKEIKDKEFKIMITKEHMKFVNEKTKNGINPYDKDFVESIKMYIITDDENYLLKMQIPLKTLVYIKKNIGVFDDALQSKIKLLNELMEGAEKRENIISRENDLDKKIEIDLDYDEPDGR